MAARRTRSGNSPALVAARESGIDHTIHEFDHNSTNTDYGQEAVRELGCDPSQVLKTLVWQVDGKPCLALVPVPDQVSAKKLAAALGQRRASLASSSQAERLTGSVVGAISPLGLKRPLPVVVDDSVAAHATVFVSAGRRGVEIELSPDDLIALTSGRLAAISLGSSEK